MYLNLLKNGLRKFGRGLFPRGMRRSAALPWLIILLVVGIPGIGWKLHRLGRFGALKREIKGENHTEETAGPSPGGFAPILLTRSETPGNTLPEFLSATVLPGLGMGVLQITAYLPHRGEVPLLMAPSLQSVADGTTGPRAGVDDLRGALEVPWGGGVGGVISPLGTTLTTNWKGQTIELPTDAQGRGTVSEGGLLASRGVDDSRKSADGLSAVGSFRSTNFDDHWPSKSDITVSVMLAPRTIDLIVDAKNVGSVPEPMGIGWHPRFTIPSGRRSAVELRLPNGERLEVGDRVRGIPTGHMIPAGTILERFQGHAMELGIDSVNETLVHLKPALLDNGAAAELRDEASGYGLRMTAVSESIRALRVTAPAGENYVSLGMQTNYEDPFGREWSAADGPGIITLEPGQTLEWRVRLEIFPILGRNGGAVE